MFSRRILLFFLITASLLYPQKHLNNGYSFLEEATVYIPRTIAFSGAETGKFIVSPSIAILPNGDYVASHDLFGPNTEQTNPSTFIYRSDDKGNTWELLTELRGQGWSTLFYHNGALYLMGTSGFERGSIIIRKSEDGGKLWTEPRYSDSGLLMKAENRGYHTAPVPVVVYNGRIWRAYEDMDGKGDWPEWFRAFAMSAPVNSDLLQATNWTMTPPISFDEKFFDFKTTNAPGWLEGNLVVTPKGKLVNILRTYSVPRFDIAAVMDVDEDGASVSFDKDKGFIDFPGGLSKFTIRYDKTSKTYYSIVNLITNPQTSISENDWDNSVYHQRNVLALTSSKDLKKWNVNYTILETNRGAALNKQNKTGYQYVDWQFDGNDIIAVCRTAMNGADTYHNANYLTFHRLQNFRKLNSKTPPQQF